MPLQILYHGNCFDGCASAAVFGRFAQERLGVAGDAITYRPLQHQQGDPFPADAFQAERVACVDFRFSPRLHWWFDHHASAFPTPAAHPSTPTGWGLPRPTRGLAVTLCLDGP